MSMMGTVEDMRKALDEIHDAPMRKRCAAVADVLIEGQQFEALGEMCEAVKIYEDLSRKYFGLKQRQKNTEERIRTYEKLLYGGSE